MMGLKISAALVTTMALALPSVSAQAEKLRLKFGHVGKPGSLFEASADNFAKCANPKLGDKAEVQNFGSSQLGKDKELLQKLKLGQITFSLPSTVMSSVTPEFGVFEMPYIIQNRDHMRKVRDEVVMTKLQEAAKKKGYRILGVWENGFRHITNNTRPINKPEDLKGIKLRTPKGAWRVKMFKSYGANPTPMAFSEVFTALKTGVMDGQENPFGNIVKISWYEVQKYISLSRHVYTPITFVMNLKRYESLTPEQRARVDVAARKAVAMSRKYGADNDATLEAEIRKKAPEVKFNDIDGKAFKKASVPIAEKIGDIAGKDFAAKFVAAAN